MLDPVLAQATPHVEALQALTQPFGTTVLESFAYFKSQLPNTSTIRTDGKRISFRNGYHKTCIQEDIDFLRKCIKIDPRGPFVEVSSDEELQAAEQVLDPIGFQERRMREALFKELAAAGVDLSPVGGPRGVAKADRSDKTPMLDHTLAVATNFEVTAPSVADHIGQEDASKVHGVDAASAAARRLALLRSSMGQAGSHNVLTGQVPSITPLSSSDIKEISKVGGGTASVVTAG